MRVLSINRHYSPFAMNNEYVENSNKTYIITLDDD